MIDEANRRRIIDAIALLEQVLRESDTTIRSAAVLRALERAGQDKPPASGDGGTRGSGGGGGDYGREDIRWHRQL